METVQARAATEAELRRFDFWLGEWDVILGDGEPATSSVYLDFADRVVVESFDGRPSSELQAMSVASYDVAGRCWRLTWVDSDGRHFAFAGGFQDGEMDLRCARDGELHRLRWFDIDPRALRWRWERSANGGWTWSTAREAAYRRVLSWADPHFATLWAAREDVRLADRAIDGLSELVQQAKKVDLESPEAARLRATEAPYPPRHL